VLPVLTGEKHVLEEREAWDHLRNPLPPGSEETLFDHVRTDLEIRPREFFTSRSLTDLHDFTRAELRDRVTDVDRGPTFLRRHNPIVRHTVLRKRSTLEARGLLDRIAVDIWPHEGVPLPMFEGQTLRTSAEIDTACKAAEGFGNALAQRVRGTGFMKAMLLQRICSSLEAGRSTAQLLLDKRTPLQEDEDDAETEALMALAESTTAERQWLLRMIEILNSKPTDPKLDAVLHFLIERRWLETWGCILFTQYHDTARWIARALTERLPEETVALYAGANKSGLFLGGEWRSVERDDIKKAVRDRRLRLLVATDAACEGLNLQTLGTLINIDLPWTRRVSSSASAGSSGSGSGASVSTCSIWSIRTRETRRSTKPSLAGWRTGTTFLDHFLTRSRISGSGTSRSSMNTSTSSSNSAKKQTLSPSAMELQSIRPAPDGSYASACWLGETWSSACRRGGSLCARRAPMPAG